jgi:hypothetical protein
MKARVGHLALASLLATYRLALADPASTAKAAYEAGIVALDACIGKGEIEKCREATQDFNMNDTIVQRPTSALNVFDAYYELASRERTGAEAHWDQAYNAWQLYEQRLATVGRIESGPNQNTAIPEDEQRYQGLARKVAVVDVTTTPAQADIYVNGVSVFAVSPRRVAVLAGVPLSISARLAGYRSAKPEDVVVKKGDTVHVELSLARIEGTLHVDSDPPGATVRVSSSGQLLGSTPLDTRLPVGSFRIDVTRPGYLDQSRGVSVIEDTPTNVALKLEPRPSTVASIGVKGTPTGATLALDHQVVGVAPTVLSNLHPGPHVLDVSAPHFDRWSTQVLLYPGVKTRVEYELKDPNDRAWPGWPWVGYSVSGALLVTGAVFSGLAFSGHSDFNDSPTSAKKSSVDSNNLTADVLIGTGLVVLAATVVWHATHARPRSSGEVK